MYHTWMGSAPGWAWAGFHLVVVIMLALDLGLFNRHARSPGVREAAGWSAVWILLALLFNGAVWKTLGSQGATEFLTGYLLEKSMSVDNLMVFVLLFAAFKVPPRNQHRILFWGVIGAMVLRAALIAAGVALLNRFSWMIFLFGAFLLFAGGRMLALPAQAARDPARGAIARAFRAIMPFDPQGGYGSLWVSRGGRHFVTPMLMVLVLLEATDLLFAVDSIPAVLSVTRNPFIVYTSNIFAILGLRSLYFLLARMVDRFRLLRPGVAVILVFVGLKMCLAKFVVLPALASLGVILLILTASVAGSMAWPRAAKGAAR